MWTERAGVLLSIHGGMEFIWRYAWVGFVTGAIVHRPFPLLEALAIYAVAAALALYSRGKGWRVFQVLGLQLGGLVPITAALVHDFYYLSAPFWDPGWIREFFKAPRSALEWLVLILLLVWVLVFWSGGLALASKSPTYLTISSRFDLGLAAFFGLFLTEWLFLTKGAIQVADPVARLLFLPFFVLSLFAIGLARTRGTGQKEYLAGYRGIGLISTFLASLTLIAAGLFLFFLPFFVATAEMGYAVMKRAAEPLGPVLIGILRFLLMGARARHAGPSATAGRPSEPGLPLSTESGWWGSLFEEFVKWGFGGILLASLLMLTSLGGWALVRWLLSRRSAPGKSETAPSLFDLWTQRIQDFLNYCRSWLSAGRNGTRGAARFYRALLGWGRRSGLPRIQSETPYEYGFRLKGRFPSLGSEFEQIIDIFHREIYAEKELQVTELISGRSAWRRLRRPYYWPSRLRSWLAQPRELQGPNP